MATEMFSLREEQEVTLSSTPRAPPASFNIISDSPEPPPVALQVAASSQAGLKIEPALPAPGHSEEPEGKRVVVVSGRSEQPEEAPSPRSIESPRSMGQPVKSPCLPGTHHGGIRQRIFVLFDDAEASYTGKILAIVMMIIIVLSTISFVVESMPEFRQRKSSCLQERTTAACEPKADPVFFWVETVCVSFFTLEYLARVFTVHAVSNKVALVLAQSNAVQRTLRYLLQPLNVVDLFAIMPYFIELAVNSDESVPALRVLRVLRILRLFKISKHHPGIGLFAKVLALSGQPLGILMFFNLILVILLASFMFYAEGNRYSVDRKFTGILTEPGDYPTGAYVRLHKSNEFDEISPFRSIPYAMWWVCVTMTTVGYGDFSPSTNLGKTIGVMTFYIGIIFLALPIIVLGTNFETVYGEMVAERGRTSVKDRPAVSFEAPKKSVTRPYDLLPHESTWRHSVFLLFEDPQASKIGNIWSLFMVAVILFSTGSFVLESMPEFNSTPIDCNFEKPTIEDCAPIPDPIFDSIEIFCIALFTVDYVFRAITVHAAVTQDCGYSDDYYFSPAMLTVRYLTQPLNLIDLAAIVPFYVQLFLEGGGGGVAVVRVLRLIRVFRVMKMPRLRSGVNMFMAVISDSLPALGLLSIMTCMMCVFFASVLFIAESSRYSLDFDPIRYPEGCYIRPTVDGYDIEVSPFLSIPYSFWWFFATATTVGYGDDYPTTAAGRIIGIMVFYVGIILLALPITIIGGNFSNHYPSWMKEFAAPKESASIVPNCDVVPIAQGVAAPESLSELKAAELALSTPLALAEQRAAFQRGGTAGAVQEESNGNGMSANHLDGSSSKQAWGS